MNASVTKPTTSLRRRLLTSIMAMVVALVALIAVPLGVVGTALVRSDAESELQRDADAIAVALQLDAELSTPFTNRQLQVLARDGQRVAVDGRGSRRTVERNFTRGGLEASASNSLGDTVTVEASDNEVAGRVAQVWILVAGLALGVVLLATGVTTFLARRLADPMAELAEVSRQLGRGDFDIAPGRHEISEIDEVSTALADSARRIGDLMVAEREFSSNASHQLRTVITGLRLQLDELQAVVPSDVDRHGNLIEAQSQVDRLERTVEDLLSLARGSTGGRADPFDLGSIVEAARTRWAAIAASQSRPLEISTAARRATASAGAIEQALDTLIDNAFVHGQGTVSITVSGSDQQPTLVVDDEGSGIPASLRNDVFERGHSTAGRTGLGLSLARNLVEAEGGRLRLTGPARFEMQLPAADAPPPPPR